MSSIKIEGVAVHQLLIDSIVVSRFYSTKYDEWKYFPLKIKW